MRGKLQTCCTLKPGENTINSPAILIRRRPEPQAHKDNCRAWSASKLTPVPVGLNRSTYVYVRVEYTVSLIRRLTFILKTVRATKSVKRGIFSLISCLFYTSREIQIISDHFRNTFRFFCGASDMSLVLPSIYVIDVLLKTWHCTIINNYVVLCIRVVTANKINTKRTKMQH